MQERAQQLFRSNYGRRFPDVAQLELDFKHKLVPRPAVTLDPRRPHLDLGDHQICLGHLQDSPIEFFTANPAAVQSDPATWGAKGASVSQANTQSRHGLSATRQQGHPIAVKLCAKTATLEAHIALLVEARLLHALSRHPQVLGLIGVVGVPEPMLLMPRMAGGPLHAFLQQHAGLEQLQVNDLVSICAQVASAMAYLESLAIIHRNLTPESIFVGRGPNEVRLAGFGKMAVGCYSHEDVWFGGS